MGLTVMIAAGSVKFSILVTALCAVLAAYCSDNEVSAEGSTWAKALPPAQAVPTESECQPYIEKAIKKLTSDGSQEESNEEQNVPSNCDETKSSTSDDGVETVENVSNEIASQEYAENTAEEDKTEQITIEVESNDIDTNEVELPKIDVSTEGGKFEEKEQSAEVKSESIEDVSSVEDEEKEAKSTEVTKDVKDESKEDNKNGETSAKVEESSEKDKSKETDDNDDDENEKDESTGTVQMKKYIPTRRLRHIEKVKSTKNFKFGKKLAKYEEKEEEDDSDDNTAAEEEEEDITKENKEENDDSGEEQDDFDTPEEELIKDKVTPKKLRNRDHIVEILQLEKEDSEQKEKLKKLIDSTLKDLKKLYDTAIKPLEILYKYRDLSNRHFGDPEIFSKPLVLFMGPWSGGKSTIINYLLGNEFADTALRTGAEPSPAYFNILMSGENQTVLDGTQLAADWTFSGLQKFGQGLLDRLKGLQIPHPLLQKVNIVEIPGILEIRKQVERVFPFNDACQWFIDRADIIFLVYDPAKLDVGPETEAILDQLKGREYQTRIVLNKADQVKAEELMRVQGTLIWNISPLMSSIQPPTMYTTSLWSMPYDKGSPARLLHAQEIAFLKDLRSAIDKRVENKIASARRFAVRVRNHAKMVDCYLTTYYNHKSFFGNKKKVNDDIVEHPQNYHIYEGLSTLTNISRYDLPDPDVYKDFFRLHPIYEFQRLSDTCTYFRGCPINRLDIAIAYDLPELVGKYKKSVENIMNPKEIQTPTASTTKTRNST